MNKATIPVQTLTGEIITNYEYEKQSGCVSFLLYFGAVIVSMIPIVGVLLIFWYAYAIYHKKTIQVIETKMNYNELGQGYVVRTPYWVIPPPMLLKSFKTQGIVFFAIGLFFIPANIAMLLAFLGK